MPRRQSQTVLKDSYGFVVRSPPCRPRCILCATAGNMPCLRYMLMLHEPCTRTVCPAVLLDTSRCPAVRCLPRTRAVAWWLFRYTFGPVAYCAPAVAYTLDAWSRSSVITMSCLSNTHRSGRKRRLNAPACGQPSCCHLRQTPAGSQGCQSSWTTLRLNARLNF